VNRLYSYGTGGATKPTDRPLMQYFTAEFAEDGYKLPDLLRTIVLSDAFTHVREVNRSAPRQALGPTEEIPLEEEQPAKEPIVAVPSQPAGMQSVALNQNQN
jgi:hypothetical protein